MASRAVCFAMRAMMVVAFLLTLVDAKKKKAVVVEEPPAFFTPLKAAWAAWAMVVGGGFLALSYQAK